MIFLADIYFIRSAYAGLEHRAAFPPQAGAAAGMRVTEVRKWEETCYNKCHHIKKWRSYGLKKITIIQFALG